MKPVAGEGFIRGKAGIWKSDLEAAKNVQRKKAFRRMEEFPEGGENVDPRALKESLALPVIMAPMFLISNPKMVIAASKAGIIGTFPSLNARTGGILDDWMTEIKESLSALEREHPGKAPALWGVNLICHRTNPRLEEDLQLIAKHQPPLVITSLGDPGPVARIVHEYDGVVFADVINIRYAKKAAERGADGLILVAAGAGGHGGTYSPFAFVHEVRTFWRGPLVLAGGMSRGEDVLAARLIGADFAYMGTRFIPSAESGASEEYKQMVQDSSIEDLIYSDAFSGIYGNFLIPSIRRTGLDPEGLKGKGRVDLSEMIGTEIKAWRDIWSAGHGVGTIVKIQSIAEIVSELKEQYEAAKKGLAESNAAIRSQA